MKKWIRFILKVNHKLDMMCFNVEQKIDKLAKSMDKPARVLCDEIYDWIDFKRRLINLRVLYNLLNEKLDSAERAALAGLDLSNASGGLLNKCGDILVSLGYGEQRFKEDYERNKKLAAVLRS